MIRCPSTVLSHPVNNVCLLGCGPLGCFLSAWRDSGLKLPRISSWLEWKDWPCWITSRWGALSPYRHPSQSPPLSINTWRLCVFLLAPSGLWKRRAGVNDTVAMETECQRRIWIHLHHVTRSTSGDSHLLSELVCKVELTISLEGWLAPQCPLVAGTPHSEEELSWVERDSEGQGSLACCSPLGLQRVGHNWAAEQERVRMET